MGSVDLARPPIHPPHTMGFGDRHHDGRAASTTATTSATATGTSSGVSGSGHGGPPMPPRQSSTASLQRHTARSASSGAGAASQDWAKRRSTSSNAGSASNNLALTAASASASASGDNTTTAAARSTAAPPDTPMTDAPSEDDDGASATAHASRKSSARSLQGQAPQAQGSNPTASPTTSVSHSRFASESAAAAASTNAAQAATRDFDRAGFPLTHAPRLNTSSPPSPQLLPTIRSAISIAGSRTQSPSRIKIRDLGHIHSFASEEVLTRHRGGVANHGANNANGPQRTASAAWSSHDAQQFEISEMPVTDIIEMVAGLLTKITNTNDHQHYRRPDTNVPASPASSRHPYSHPPSYASSHPDTPAHGHSHNHNDSHTHAQAQSRHPVQSPVPTLPNDSTSATSRQAASVLAFHGKNVPSISILSYLARIHKYCPTTYEVFLSLLVYFDRMMEAVNRGILASFVSAASGATRPVLAPGASAHVPQDAALPATSPMVVDEPLPTSQSRPQLFAQSSQNASQHGSSARNDDAARQDNEGSRSFSQETAQASAQGNPADEAFSRTLADAHARSIGNLASATTSAMEQDLQRRSQGFVVDSFNIHRLVIAGVTCASKFFSDVFYTNSRYAKVGGLPIHELNHLELQFLLLNDFRLSVPVEELEAYGSRLVKFYAEEVMAQQLQQAQSGSDNAHESGASATGQPPLGSSGYVTTGFASNSTSGVAGGSSGPSAAPADALYMRPSSSSSSTRPSSATTPTPATSEPFLGA